MKTNILINKIHKKNTNIKDWHLHHFINELVSYMQEKQITKLKMEKLNVKAMTSREQDDINSKNIGKENSKSMRKNILHVSFSKLQQILNYKCVQIGIVVEYVEAKNTSKRCHCCGEVNNTLTLKDRQWQCSHCFNVNDRDINAAINIKDSNITG